MGENGSKWEKMGANGRKWEQMGRTIINKYDQLEYYVVVVNKNEIKITDDTGANKQLRANDLAGGGEAGDRRERFQTVGASWCALLRWAADGDVTFS
eukprot:1188144-Prorocentrum_minimum.AAC.2